MNFTWKAFSILLLSGVGLFSCGEKEKDNVYYTQPDSVGIKFENRVKALGYKLDSIGKDGVYYVNTGQKIFQVSLENARQAYQNTKKYDALEEILAQFQNTIQADSIENWNWAKERLYIYLAQKGNNYKGVPHKNISPFLNSVYIVYDGKRFIWVDSTMIDKWKVTEKEIEKISDDNMYSVLRRSTIRKGSLDGVQVGFLETELPFASSFMFIPRFKWRVDQDFSWPCYAVAPVRNFACVFSRENFIPFRDKLGPRVKREFLQGSYPLSLEIFRFNDKGTEVVGAFQ